MKFILKLRKVLIFFMVLIGVSVASAENVKKKIVAEVNGTSITLFEVKTFLNKVVPIGKFHVQSLNKKEYWDKALKSAVDARTLVLYLKNINSPIYDKASKKAKLIVETIKKRFKDDKEYKRALQENGITENELINTYRDISVKNVIKDEIMGRKIKEEVLLDYYKKNQGMFATGESLVVKNCLVKADARYLSPEEMKKKKEFAINLKKMISKGDEQAWKRCDKGLYPEKDEVFMFNKNYPAKDIFNLKIGEVGGPYKNIYGFLIVKVLKRNPSKIISFDETKGEIERIMKLKMFKDEYKKLLEKAKNEMDIKIFGFNSSS